MEEQVGLVVAERAERIISKVRLVERHRRQPAHPREVGDVFKVADEVACEVELLKRAAVRERIADGADAVGAEPELGELRHIVQPLHPLDGVLVQPQRLQLGELREHRLLHFGQLIVAEIKVR